MAELLDQIQRAAEAHPGVSDWTVRETRQDSTQLFLIGQEPEAVRHVQTVRYDLAIYHDHEGGRGEATFNLEPAAIAALPARLDEAVYLAALGRNPPYSLPRPPAAYPDAPATDPAISTPAAAAETARSIVDAARAGLAAEPEVRLSSMELFLSSAEVTLRTSTGVQATRSGTLAECELVVTSRNAAGEESEAQDLWARRRASDLDVARRARQQAQYARDSLRSRLPRSGDLLVVIPAETLLPFFDPVIYRSAASARHREATPWEVGRPIAPPGTGAFDPLDLSSDALLPFGLETRAFDEQGLPGQRYDLLRGGVLQGFWATQRYADYLGISATGAPANLDLAPGQSPAAMLRRPAGVAPVLEVVTFSWLNPEALTGDFTGEIRLGYEHGPGGRVPVKGGAVSGNVFQALTQAEFSRETVFAGRYRGPAMARFHGLTVAG